MSKEPCGSHHFQGNAGDVIGVQELLDTVIQHGNGNEVARNRRSESRGTRVLLLAEARRQRQRTAAEGQFPERERDAKAIVQILHAGRGVHQHDEEEKRQGQHTR